MTIQRLRDELTAEFEAFERDLRKLRNRMDEIDTEADALVGRFLDPNALDAGDFLRGLRVAKDHVSSSWRSVQYARQNVNNK